MENREQRIYEEAAALWQEVFGEPPPRAEPGALLDAIMNNLPLADYDRLRSPHLRATVFTRPGAVDAQL